MSAEALADARKREALDHALGAEILTALGEPDVVEVLANPDGRLIIDRLGEGRQPLEVRLTPQARERVIRLVADYVGEPITREDPRLAGVLPTGERFQGFLPPVTTQPAFSVRKRPAVIWSLEAYVEIGILSQRHAEILREAVAARRNLVISGGAGSGKTTLANAILAEPAFAADRVFLIEDTPELQCSAWDLVAVLTRRRPRPITVADLVRDALRMRPDRIVIGEMREGQAALETLKAWNTGHPGGVTTVHANSAEEVLFRLEDLLAEVTANPPRRLIAQAVDLIVHIQRAGAARRVEGLLVRDKAEGGSGYRVVPA
ncbi:MULTISPECIES: P-type conjugative transfer ATPase TrbB [unclassified Phenylobacterium]|uniref:P-type conjugative transfer ATPase TrbB n=1 Tax=unclassified Phenylobacterium TaxID=2640670 RepID=UPI00083A7EE8|nr:MULTISPECIES: P-type conjugative transfer ATPase TrbB [unclassified Phenylobacterium]